MSLPIKIFLKLFKNNIKNINIYQSFYFEISKIILKNKNIIKYNFIHDLIPITNPEVCGDACLSFDPCNKEELVRDMYEIYHNEGLRKELIQKGFEQSKKFDWKKTIDTIVNYYNSNS